MASSFGGFSEEDVKRIKSGNTGVNNEMQANTSKVKKIDKLGTKPKRPSPQYKLHLPPDNEDAIENITFEKCKLSLKTPTPDILNNNIEQSKSDMVDINLGSNDSSSKDVVISNDDLLSKDVVISNDSLSKDEQIVYQSIVTDQNDELNQNRTEMLSNKTPEPVEDRKYSIVSVPEFSSIITGNYTENELAVQKAKLEDLQLRQKLMEEQNKKRKEMLAKALADRTKQTEEEVMKLEKIKKELQILDGQFSQDVSLLRKKIDQACNTYSEAEKTYLKIEKEFLQAKINLQKEKEKKELLTEHLCALITHNETRKAKKLETLMMQLAYDVNNDEALNLDDRRQSYDDHQQIRHDDKNITIDEDPVIVDGVDERTGKMVELNL